MSMTVGTGGENNPMIDMNTTPLIDVMLVLLIMIIVTLPIMTHAVKLDMPRPDPSTPDVQPELIEIVIDYDGTILWNGTQVPNIDTLERYFNTEAAKIPQPQVAIRPDARVKYDYVVQVLAAAQRNRIEKMGLIGNEQFE